MARVREGVSWRIVDNQALLLDIDSGDYFSLNQTGTEIWKLLDQGMTQEEISRILADRYQVAREQIESDLAELVGTLKEANIME